MRETIKFKGESYLEDLEELEKNNVIPFIKPRLITGGKGPPGNNWLSKLPIETIFLCKASQAGGFALGQFHVLHSFEDAVHLMDNLQGETHIWVDPSAFSNQFKLVRILFTPEYEDGSIEH